MAGPAERRFLRAAPLHVGLTCVVVVLSVLALAAPALPADRRGLGWPVMAAVAGLVCLRAALAGRSGPALGWLLGADAVVLCAAGVLQPSIEVPFLLADGIGWVQIAVVAAVMSHQCRPPGVIALVVAGGCALCFGLGAVRTVGPQLTSVLLPAVWIVGCALIARALFGFLRVGARAVDAAARRRADAEAEVDAAAARKASEQAHLAALHDTAAATLLMVGLGTVDADAPWLARQADRALRALDTPEPGNGGDLLTELCAVGADSGLAVRVTGEPVGTAAALPGEASLALLGAAGEALRNVAGHAGVDVVEIAVAHGPDRIRIEISDAGRGLTSPAGRGIRHSIVDRMERAGGRAMVAGRPEGGVRVTLCWPDD